MQDGTQSNGKRCYAQSMGARFRGQYGKDYAIDSGGKRIRSALQNGTRAGSLVSS